MNGLLKSGIRLLLIGSGCYVLLCATLYAFQNKLIFFPQKLDNDYAFQFEHPFEEIIIETDDHIKLNGVLFKAETAKGLIFYLHGNAGSIDTWGNVSLSYTLMNYDLFILDYRGYGKSEGEITSEAQFYSDIQKSYDVMKSRYDEKNIVVLGYSIGTAAAAWLTAQNNPRMLILQAPYYSLADLVQHTYPFVPTVLLNYSFETFRYVADTDVPITIFHGDQDRVIYYESSLKLKQHLKPGDTLVTLIGQGHNGMSYNRQYRSALERRLATTRLNP